MQEHHHETMPAAEAEQVIRAGLQFRRALLTSKRDLRPFNNPFYRMLDDAMESVDRTLQAVSGRPLNYRVADLGLLAPASATKPWEGG